MEEGFLYALVLYVRNLVRYNNSERRVNMINLNISNARDKLYNLASSCIKYNDVVTISTKEGNVVLLSEDDYRSLIESLFLAGVKGVYEDIEEAVKTPTSEFSKDAPWK